jgi:hypothetical protein
MIFSVGWETLGDALATIAAAATAWRARVEGLVMGAPRI